VKPIEREGDPTGLLPSRRERKRVAEQRLGVGHGQNHEVAHSSCSGCSCRRGPRATPRDRLAATRSARSASQHRRPLHPVERVNVNADSPAGVVNEWKPLGNRAVGRPDVGRTTRHGVRQASVACDRHAAAGAPRSRHSRRRHRIVEAVRRLLMAASAQRGTVAVHA
jgi:hypothetical protein